MQDEGTPLKRDIIGSTCINIWIIYIEGLVVDEEGLWYFKQVMFQVLEEELWEHGC